MSSRITDDVQEALADGANEIDLVLPYGAVRRGDHAAAAEMVEAVREMVDQDRLLKVILETGELKDPALVETASRLAIEAGADFIKTSTGKTPVSATPEAAEIMLNAIKASGRSGGPEALRRHPHARRREALSRSRRPDHGTGLGDAADVPHRRQQRLRRADRRDRRAGRRGPCRGVLG